MDREAYFNALDRYQGFRDAAYDLTWSDLSRSVPSGSDLRIMPIDESALTFWRAIQHFNAVHPTGGFPWDEIFKQVYSTPKRFDIAIWDGSVLCGLCCGMASRGNQFVTLKWLERFETDRNGLKGMIAEIAITAADHYAKIINRQYVRLKDPIPEAVKHVYAPLGFVLAEKRKGHIYYQRAVE